MAIYKRCPECKTDNRLNRKKCTHCSSLLEARYRVKVKLPNGRWSSRLLPVGNTLKQARATENELALSGADLEPSHRERTGNAGYHPQAIPSSLPSISFDAYYAAAKLTKKSHKNDLELWKKHVSHRDYLTTQGILEILGDMQDKGYAPATIKHVLTFIKRLYNWHIEMDLLPEGTNPAAKIRLKKIDNTVSNALSLEQVSVLLSFLKKHENRPMAIVTSLAVLTGRRQGELLGLRKEDVDLHGRTMRCKNTKNGKTLVFPLNAMACDLLREALEICPEGSELLFPYTRNGFKTNWYRLRSKLLRKGVLSSPRFRFHDLRHTYATVLCNSGQVDIYTLQKLMGHSCLELTQRYAHLLDQTMRAATGVLDDII